MALDEEQSSAAHEIRRAIDCVRECADLTGVDPATLEALAAGRCISRCRPAACCSTPDPLRTEYICSRAAA